MGKKAVLVRSPFALPLALLVMLPALAACTALLGSYDVGPSAAPSSEGGLDATSDVSAGQEGGGVEAGSEAGDGGSSLLRCSIDEKNARTLDAAPLQPTVSAYQIRVIASKAGQGVVIYTYDRNGGNPPQILPVPKIGRVLQVRRLANGIAIMSVDNAPSPGFGTSIGVWLVDDATSNPTRTSFKLIPPSNNMSGAFGLLGSDYLFAYSDGATIQAGRFVPGAVSVITVASGLNGGGAGTVSDVEVANGKLYVFNDVGPDPSNNNASSGYYVLDDALTTAGPLVSLGSGAPGKGAFRIAGDSALGNFQLAVADLDFANGTPPAVLHAGSIPTAKATDFNVLDIPTAFTFTTLVDAPFGGQGSARFQGSDFIALGPNPNKDPGLDFLWYETKLKVLRAFNGDSTKLMPTRSVSAVAAIGVQTTGIIASFEVVWIENATQDPDAGAQSKLFSAQMSCLK